MGQRCPRVWSIIAPPMGGALAHYPEEKRDNRSRKEKQRRHTGKPRSIRRKRSTKRRSEKKRASRVRRKEQEREREVRRRPVAKRQRTEIRVIVLSEREGIMTATAQMKDITAAILQRNYHITTSAESTGNMGTERETEQCWITERETETHWNVGDTSIRRVETPTMTEVGPIPVPGLL